MDTKLTLKLEKTIIEKAKDYAKALRTFLSTLIENYLLNIRNLSSIVIFCLKPNKSGEFLYHCLMPR